MCGEIQPWQVARTVAVRLTTSGAQQIVTLNAKLERVEEIWIDEMLVTGFNGGVSASAYFNLQINGMHPANCNNEPVSGVLLMVDVLNPHTVFQRPKSVAEGHLATVNSMKLSINFPVTGTAVTFTEACFSMTFVCRRSTDELEEIRRLKAALDYAPNLRDGATRVTGSFK